VVNKTIGKEVEGREKGEHNLMQKTDFEMRILKKK